ncbi:hypothetical protein MR857_12040 [bacterium]|nr:hypothetical protein [bacterium]MDY3021715.1 hypothetical protein [Oliverpabstia sp.]
MNLHWKLSITLLFLVLSLGFSGCRGKDSLSLKDNKNVENETLEKNIISFDPLMKTFEKEQDNIRMDAQVSIPDTVKDNQICCASGLPLPLKEQTSELAESFFPTDSVPSISFDEENNSFFGMEYKVGEPGWVVLGYNNSAGFVLNSQEYDYCKNCIVTENFVESYNGDQYQKNENLDFMTQKNAANLIRTTLKQYGISLGDIVTVYVMDHETMQQYEDATDMNGNYDPDLKKDSWSSEDDSYYFYFFQEYNDFPVIYNPYSGQGLEDGEAATVMMNASGIIGANIMGCYEWKEDEKVTILSLEEAAETFFRNYQGIVNTSYEVDHISLMMDIIPGENNTAQLKPAWVFHTEVSGEGYCYQSQIVIDAVNGVELTA